MVSFTYVFSILLKTEYIGQLSILLLNLILGCIFAIAVITMRLYKKLITFADILAYILRIIPSFCFCYGYNQLIRKHEIYFLDHKFAFYNYLSIYEEDLDENIISLKHVGADCIYLAVESLIYLLILIILENTLNKSYKKNDVNLAEFPENKDVNLGESQKEDQQNKKYAIKVKDLIKIYKIGCCKKKKAVKRISFNLEDGEIFGFLGTNGAGKTTTFKCLSNEIVPSYGNIFIKDYDITKNFNKVRNLIGYCPQFDTIFEFMTVYENLKFYGIVKGAKEDKLDNIIEALMKEMKLLDFKDKISGTLSGGNKRKLSMSLQQEWTQKQEDICGKQFIMFLLIEKNRLLL